MNLIEKLGLEKCKQIVERHRKLGTHFTKFKYYSVKKDDFFLSQLFIDSICVEDLRTAIAEHESKMHSHLTSGVFQDDDHTDHVTDIRNHISPNTRVSESHVNEAFKLNRLG